MKDLYEQHQKEKAAKEPQPEQVSKAAKEREAANELAQEQPKEFVAQPIRNEIDVDEAQLELVQKRPKKKAKVVPPPEKMVVEQEVEEEEEKEEEAAEAADQQVEKSGDATETTEEAEKQVGKTAEAEEAKPAADADAEMQEH